MARKKTGTRTNIASWHRQNFRQMANGRGQFALFSCFVNGEPTSAIVSLDRHNQDVIVRPLFVAVTPGMTIVDHDGTEIRPIS